jgi:GH25 family lysozyme M1 (1,4-beta-N-acetylmuramidase)
MKERGRFFRYILLIFILAVMLVLASGCRQYKRVTRELETVTMGIDVARYQGTIDWQEVASGDVDFAIVRIGYRGMSDGVIKEDPNGRYNMQEAAKAGIPLGVYFFSTAITEEEAHEEAEWVADMIAGYPITYPVVYDCENFNDSGSRQYFMNKTERTDAALAFLKAIEKKGYEGMFYASKVDMEQEKSWEMSRIEEDYKIWVVQYPALPYPETKQTSYSGTHHMWQYSMEGSVPGIRQNVDLNIAYFGYDGIEPPHSKTVPEEVEVDVEAMMDFDEVSDQVTAKKETNLRNIPSQDTDSEVLRTLLNGEIAQRIAVSSSGWSKLLIDGNIYYAVTNYLTTDLEYQAPPEEEYLPSEMGIQTQFVGTNQLVTAKQRVNLRKLPSVEHEDAVVLDELNNGEIATCVGVSDNGWSKLIYKGVTCYAVTSYLKEVTDASAVPDGGQMEMKPTENIEEQLDIQTQFDYVDDKVTAKKAVNLRSLPSVEDPRCVVVAQLDHGVVIRRTGINHDLGWSRVDYNGRPLYCITSYLKVVN